MKYSIFIFALLGFFATEGFGQKIKLSKDAKGKYVKDQNEASDVEEYFAVYYIVQLEFEDNGEDMTVSLNRGSGEIPSKSSVMVFPELEKLGKLKLTKNGEVDLLNYLSENDWEIFAVETQVERKTSYRQLYLRKYVKL